ncbi:MAG: tRNA-dihydrouridine synthase [Ardenticatenaceae bacterium]|nr:tRNA-dihydrouridine synthase [Ardenticatenaceae bacterium]
MKAHTGCDAVMIGRAAIGNPWIFARQRREELAIGDIIKAVRLHAHEMVAYYGEAPGLRQFRKHLKCYFEDIPGLELDSLLGTESFVEFEEGLEGWERPLLLTFVSKFAGKPKLAFQLRFSPKLKVRILRTFRSIYQDRHGTDAVELQIDDDGRRLGCKTRRAPQSLHQYC